MNDLNEGEILASYALFRELYNSNCKDIYDIIVEFIKDVIVTEGKYSFSLNEITQLVNTTYGFQIPDYVIAPSVMRIEGVTKNEGIYYLPKLDHTRNSIFEINYSEVINSNNKIICELFAYIEEIKKCILTSKEKDKILNSFYAFLLEEINGHEYAELISAFVIKNRSNTQFVNQLDSIREGVVLYTGINYNNRINEVGTWKNELTIYLEMEILFHIVGYNGIVFRELADELLMLIQNVKSSKNKRLIKLRYFIDTKDQIERFFDKAEYIVNGQAILSSDNIAMKEIINGCKSVSDVIDKKSDFYRIINNKGIIIDDESDYYKDDCSCYNLEDAATLDKFSSDNPDESFKRLKFISNINKLRKGKVKCDYADCAFILLTNSTKTLKMSKLLSQQNDTVPYAINMATLTNLIWYRMNAGFGAKNFPKTIDVIIKAQIILSKFVNDSIGMKYLELKEQYKNKAIDEEQIIARLANLRNLAKKPEDIITDTLEEVLINITEDRIDKYQQEHELYKAKAIESERKNEELLDTLNTYRDENEKLKKRLEIKNEIDMKEREMKQLKSHILALTEITEKLDRKVKILYRNYKIILSMLILLYYGLIIGVTMKLGWNKMEMITYFLSLIPVIGGLIYTVITSKSVNIILVLENLKEKIRKKIYSGNDKIKETVDYNKIAIVELQVDINDLTDKLKLLV